MKTIKFLLLAMVLGASFVSVEATQTRSGKGLTGGDWSDARRIVPHPDSGVADEAFVVNSAERLAAAEQLDFAFGLHFEACHKRAIRLTGAAIAWLVAAGYNSLFGAKAKAE